MSTTQGAPALRLSELLGVLSFGVDLGMGQPMEHVLRQAMIALGLAERIGLDADERDAVYFGSLLAEAKSVRRTSCFSTVSSPNHLACS